MGEYARCQQEKKERAAVGVLMLEDAAADLSDAAAALAERAALVSDHPWEEIEDNLFSTLEAAISGWKAAKAFRPEGE